MVPVPVLPELVDSSVAPSGQVSTPFTVVGVVPSEQVSVPVVLVLVDSSVAPSAQVSTPLTVVGVVPSEQVSVGVVVLPLNNEFDVVVEVVIVPKASTIVPVLKAASWVSPVVPDDGVPLIS